MTSKDSVLFLCYLPSWDFGPRLPRLAVSPRLEVWYSRAGGGTATAEVFNPSTGEFRPTKNMIASRMGHGAARLTNGQVLLAGATDSCCTALGDLFNPTTGAFSATATGGTQAVWLAGTLLQDGRVFLAGGELEVLISGGSTRCCLYGPDSVATTLLFESSNNSFVSAGDMSMSRAFHTATRIGDGEVLIAGGATVHSFPRLSKVVTSVTPVASAELFNPANYDLCQHRQHDHCSRLAHSDPVGERKRTRRRWVNAGGTVLSSAELYH
jgi:hypothetical protein